LRWMARAGAVIGGSVKEYRIKTERTRYISPAAAASGAPLDAPVLKA
jgi:hypothetical protein